MGTAGNCGSLLLLLLAVDGVPLQFNDLIESIRDDLEDNYLGLFMIELEPFSFYKNG
ncbi:hypothetical protein ACO0LB_00295 [Undibacterium sp. SXout7W]|uniref:hypothetical protein n=1 Tax=Undibacterium sp. SXout7W TaxID=3413049 RepID=UPI003BF2701C